MEVHAVEKIGIIIHGINGIPSIVQLNGHTRSPTTSQLVMAMVINSSSKY